MNCTTIILTVNNRVGVLARIAGLLSSRGHNIESLIAAPTERPDTYKIHLVVRGPKEKIEQAKKQLNNLVDTLRLVDITHRHRTVVREYILIKVRTGRDPSAVFELAAACDARIVDAGPRSMTLDLAGPVGKVERLIESLRPLGILEFVRSGSIALGDDEESRKRKPDDEFLPLQGELRDEFSIPSAGIQER